MALLNVLRRNEWAIIGGLAVLAFTLGVIGIVSHGGDLTDAIYFSLRLFRFDYDLQSQSKGPYDPYMSNRWLEVARILAPLTLAFAVIKGVMLAATQRLNSWVISRWTDHAVVCGAGERGRQLAIALRGEGRRVVVIEKNAQADTLADIRTAGARVIIGSGTDPVRQVEARLDQASIVAAVTPCEESNLQVVLAANRRPNGRPLRALADVTRPFAEIFQDRPPFDRIEGSRECVFFDHEVAAARVLVGQYAPPLVPTLLREQRAARILLAGDGAILPELLAVVVTQCQFAGSGVPSITLLTTDTDAVSRSFPLQHPQRGLVANLYVRLLTLSHLLRLDLERLDMPGIVRPLDLVFVACREDINTLSLARNLAQQAGWVSGDVVAALRPSTQLMRLLVCDQPMAGVRVHDIVGLGCSGDVVLHGRLDRIARGIHERYLAEELKRGRTLGATPALVPWEQLPEGLRRANRAQADHLPIKRRTLEMSRSVDMIEAAAVAEHRRWMAEKIVSGWRHASERDDRRRLHPSIRPYDELSDDEKRKDRDTVLAAVGAD